MEYIGDMIYMSPCRTVYLRDGYSRNQAAYIQELRVSVEFMQREIAVEPSKGQRPPRKRPWKHGGTILIACEAVAPGFHSDLLLE